MAALNSPFLLLLLLATTTLLLHTTTAAPTPAPDPASIPGGYVVIPDVKHNAKPELTSLVPLLVELGEFAIQEYNYLSEDHLVFSEVLRARPALNPNGSSTYTLVIYALRDGKPSIYQAVVYVFLKTRELLSFTYLLPTGPVTTKPVIPPLLGVWSIIRNVMNNSEVQELGRYAVQEYNKQVSTNETLTFSKVVEAKQRPVPATNNYLYISALYNYNRAPDLFEAYLFVFSGNEKLISFKPHVFPDP